MPAFRTSRQQPNQQRPFLSTFGYPVRGRARPAGVDAPPTASRLPTWTARGPSADCAALALTGGCRTTSAHQASRPSSADQGHAQGLRQKSDLTPSLEAIPAATMGEVDARCQKLFGMDHNRLVDRMADNLVAVAESGNRRIRTGMGTEPPDASPTAATSPTAPPARRSGRRVQPTRR